MSNSKSIKDKSFNDLMTELEEISVWLEGDHTDLDKALAQFEKGMEIVGELQQRLGDAEQKIEKIKLKHQPKSE